MEDDPYIPAGSEPPRRGAVPVRFFGTYDFSWIESQRMLQPFQEGFADKSQQPDEDGFGDAVREAQAFLATGVLPEGFELALLEQDDPLPRAAAAPPPAAPPKAKPAATPAKRKTAPAARTDDAAPPPAAKPRQRTKSTPKAQARKVDLGSADERLQGIRRGLGLEAPADSPFAHAPCLDGLRQLLGQA
jgi:pyruvate/2-oxoglutarate dehydrogenase complex dihydrolipoamide acyltransferase (E2) component